MSTAFARRLNLAKDAQEPRETDHPVARFRPRELMRLMAIRHGRVLPDDETGARFRDRVLDTFALLGSKGRRRAENFLVLRCRWMTAVQRADAIEVAFELRRFWSAEALGNDLDVTQAEHERARLRTFRVAGMTDEAMQARKKAADSARKKAKRDAARLHSKPKLSRSAQRLEAILKLLTKPGDWVCIKALSAELKRRKVIHFVTLTGATLTSAVHDAVRLGLETGQLEKRLVDGPKFKVAEIARSRR